MTSTQKGRDGEGGSVLVLFCVTMTVVLSMAALVVDLSQLRADRQVNKRVADTAVRAGLARLQAGAWAGVCRASGYLKANGGSTSFDSGSESWFTLGSPGTALMANPCLSTGSIPYITQCRGNDPTTWGKLTATAGGGRYAAEIQAGYVLPDSRFAEDALMTADAGDPLKGSCDKLVVIIKEVRSPLLGGVMDQADKSTTVRSVGKLSQGDTDDYNPAVLLLEQQGCSVLTVTSENARVIAQPFRDHPGVIQIDSASNQGGCTQNQAVLNGKATSGGPSIVACSAKTSNPTPGCNLATSDKPSRIGMFALNFPRAPTDYVTSTYPGTYGDKLAVPSAQSGRTPIDESYRSSVTSLDTTAKSVLTGNSGSPPGCTTITNNLCTGTDGEWLVLQQADCNAFASFFAAVPQRAASPRIWFNCALNVSSPLTLSASSSYIVVTQTLSMTATFAIIDPRRVYIGGSSTGNKIGLAIGNGGNLNIGNPQPMAACPQVVPMVKYTEVVVGDGSFNMSSGGAAHLCGTFMFMANGYGKVPTTDGTPPCSSPCSGYLGHVTIGSGSVIDWSAPNLITNRRSTLSDFQTISRFEDVALWTEAGGTSNGVNGGSESKMSGVYFIGNADSFSFAGAAGANVHLSAQFIARRMSVTGGAVLNLVLNPFDAVPFVIYELTLIR